MSSPDDLYNQLAFYTLSHTDPAFIHQLVVDAYTAQSADDSAKPITVVFALVGLYLHIEKGYTGKQVQRAHMQLANRSKTWPKLPMPADRGHARIEEVLAADPGPARDAAIEHWCAAVWRSWSGCRPVIAAIARQHLDID